MSSPLVDARAEGGILGTGTVDLELPERTFTTPVVSAGASEERKKSYRGPVLRSGISRHEAQQGGSTLLNVLLMLSTREDPDPVMEAAWHVQHCAKRGSTFLVTTRVIEGLTPGRSCVAFYADSASGNRFLGRGCYKNHVGFDTDRGRQILKDSGLYSRYGTPKKSKAFIELTTVQAARQGESLEVLDGTIRASGLALTRSNLPAGPSRAQVYFWTDRATC